MYRWIFIILLSSNFCNSNAQDSLQLRPFQQKKSVTKNKFFVRDSLYCRVGIDAIGLGQVFFTPKLAFHINSDIAFRNKSLLVAEYTWARRQESQLASYQSQSSIVRVGWLHNFLYKQSKDDVFGMGARIANAWIKEQIEATINNPLFGNEPVFLRQNLQATWIEFNMELKARIWKNLLVGYCLRYQFRPALRGEQFFVPYSIASVGVTKRNNWGFQYGIWYKF